MADVEKNIYYARLAEQGERFEDICTYMKAVIKVSLAPAQTGTHPPNQRFSAVRPPTHQSRAQPALSRLQKYSCFAPRCLENAQRHPGNRRLQKVQR